MIDMVMVFSLTIQGESVVGFLRAQSAMVYSTWCDSRNQCERVIDKVMNRCTHVHCGSIHTCSCRDVIIISIAIIKMRLCHIAMWDLYGI